MKKLVKNANDFVLAVLMLALSLFLLLYPNITSNIPSVSPSLFIVGSSTSTGSYGLMGLNNQFRYHITQCSTKAVKTQITVKFRTSHTILILTE